MEVRVIKYFFYTEVIENSLKAGVSALSLLLVNDYWSVQSTETVHEYLMNKTLYQMSFN